VTGPHTTPNGIAERGVARLPPSLARSSGDCKAHTSAAEVQKQQADESGEGVQRRTLVAKFAELIEEGEDLDRAGAASFFKWSSQCRQSRGASLNYTLAPGYRHSKYHVAGCGRLARTIPYKLTLTRENATRRVDGSASVELVAKRRLPASGNCRRSWLSSFFSGRVESTLSEGLLVLPSSTSRESSDLARRLPTIVPARNRGCLS
jgi:hypothetical protein